jgi:sigma-E factor negative regulatory protein RseC
MNREEGIVVATTGDKARLKVGRHIECRSCGVCPGNDAALIDVKNPIGAGVGQRVLFEAKRTNALKGAFIVFILPIAAGLAGAAIDGFANGFANGAAAFRIAFGLFAFVLACLFVKLFDRSVEKKEASLARIVRIIESPGESK